MKFDIHIHTRFSPCSNQGITEIIEQAGHVGLDGICITDHNTMEAVNYIHEGLQENGLCVICGIEYDTSQGDFLVFLPDQCEICDSNIRFNAEKLLYYVYKQGGVAVAAHPFRKDRSVPEYLVREGKCSIVEAINGRNSDYENSLVNGWMDKYRLRACGGSDAHDLYEIGSVYTEFDTSITSRDEFIIALRNGYYYPVINQNHAGD